MTARLAFQWGWAIVEVIGCGHLCGVLKVGLNWIAHVA